MVGEKTIHIKDHKVILNSERSVFFPHTRTIILSDVHLGKAGHFRKNGLAVPNNVSSRDTKRLFDLVDYYSAEQLVIAGDFFHANLNSELELFKNKRTEYSELTMVLVKGNHDTWSDKKYEDLSFKLYDDSYNLSTDIIIRHEVKANESRYQICGHIHPGIRMKGPGKQYLRLPCFHYNDHQLVLPAFSLFTGLDTKFELKKQKSVVICENELVELD